MHEHFAKNPHFVAMFLDEARLVTRINHPNVVPTLDVVALEHELLLVMEYVCGESLSGLLKRCREAARLPPIPVVVDIVVGVLNGLHAAHEATSADGQLLNIVHRDVTPHNVLVGIDGVTRMVDFGVAKATGIKHQTRIGEIKGKLSYMAPEQMEGAQVSRAADIYSAAVVLWEALTCQRLFKGEHEGAIVRSVLNHRVPAPSHVRPDVPLILDAIISRGLNRDPDERWESANAMAEALESAVKPVTRGAVSSWVKETARDVIRKRQENLASVEASVMPIRVSSVPPRTKPELVPTVPPRTKPELVPTVPPRMTTAEASAVGESLDATLVLSKSTPWQSLHRSRLLTLGGVSVVAAVFLIWALSRSQDVRPSTQGAALPTMASGTVQPLLPSVSTMPAGPDMSHSAAPNSIASATTTATPRTNSPSKRPQKRVAPPSQAHTKSPKSERLYMRD